MLCRKQYLPDELPGWLNWWRQVLIFEVAVHVCDPGRNGFKIPIDRSVLPARGVVLLVFRQLLNEGYEIGLSRNLLDKNIETHLMPLMVIELPLLVVVNFQDCNAAFSALIKRQRIGKLAC